MTQLLECKKLIAHIRNAILKNKGAISFAKFMEYALYTPKLGYYNHKATIFGKTGDFITAPEISPLFAACVATSCQEILEKMAEKNPNKATGDIVEFGAGTGSFARDLIQALTINNKNNINNYIPRRYFIIEKSKLLREKQKILLKASCPEFFKKFRWRKTMPKNIRGIVFANELLDAFPVICFMLGEKNKNSERVIYERLITWDENKNQFIWIAKPAVPKLAKYIQATLGDTKNFPENYSSEIRINIKHWLKPIANNLTEGVLLLIDYGYGRNEYYHPERIHGTLSCFYQHQYHRDPLILLGQQDITAHVNFTDLVKEAEKQRFHLLGYTTQAAFLLSAGLTEHMENSAKNNPSPDKIYQQAQAVKTLLLPGEMGEIIKVMALGKNINTLNFGFSLTDLRAKL